METNKLTEKQKELLREFVDFTCEECGKTELELGGEKLQPHRIHQGRPYSLRIIKMCCGRCHKMFSSAQRIANGTQR